MAGLQARRRFEQSTRYACLPNIKRTGPAGAGLSIHYYYYHYHIGLRIAIMTCTRLLTIAFAALLATTVLLAAVEAASFSPGGFLCIHVWFHFVRRYRSGVDADDKKNSGMSASS